MKPALSSKSLEEQAYQALRDMILRGELAPGQKLVQEDLAARLGVSRTPLRSAIANLQRDDFVEIGARNEAFVAEFGLERIASIFEIRAVLEGLTCRLLAPTIARKHTVYLRSLMSSASIALENDDYSEYRQADIEFHTHLTNLVSDSLLTRTLETMHVIMSMSLAQGLLRSPAETLGEHLAIVDALEAHDPDLAEQRMLQHIRKTIALINERIAKSEGV